MNEELQSKLVEIIGSIQAGVSKAGDFAAEQLPDIATQYIVYGRITSVISVLAGVALLGSVGVAINYIKKEVKKDSYEMCEGCCVGSGAYAAVAGVIGSMTLFCSVPQAIMVWFAPKVWLLKELASLIR